MNINRDLTFVGAMLTLVLGAIVFGYINYGETRVQQREHLEHRDQLLKGFTEEIEKAKKETGSECSQVFVSYIRAPEGISAIAPIIIMGEEIYLGSDEPSRRMWRMNYQLIPNGDKVELWKTQWLGEAIPPNDEDIRREKISEKYSPNSSRCKAR